METEGENKAHGDEEKFGKVVDALHNKSKLSSLRTYEGDVAEFIKSKNESVVSIAVKEKEAKEKKKEEELKLNPKPKADKEGIQINLTIVILSLLLLVGGGVAFLYLYEFLNRKPVVEIVENPQIIPYNDEITLANSTKESLGQELLNLPAQNGVSIVKISDTNGNMLSKTEDLLGFLQISPPSTLLRTMKDEFVIGVFAQGDKKSYFMVLTISDFGQAFAGMLEWEDAMREDLSFLNINSNSSNLNTPNQTATSTSTTTPVVIPKPSSSYVWRDLIVKNKDTRSYANDANNAEIAYTFLDKDTVLIVNDIMAVGEIASMYASRSVTR